MTDTRSTPASSSCARVVFIGAGPGEADLITVRGARLLAQAKVVLFDALADPTLRDLAPDAEWVDARKVLVTDDRFGAALPLAEDTAARLSELVVPHLSRGAVPVLGGYIGASRPMGG